MQGQGLGKRKLCEGTHLCLENEEMLPRVGRRKTVSVYHMQLNMTEKGQDFTLRAIETFTWAGNMTEPALHGRQPSTPFTLIIPPSKTFNFFQMT